MNRTSAIPVVVLSMACIFATHQAGAQPPKIAPLSEAQKEYAEATMRAEELARALRAVGSPDSNSASLREKLSPLVEASFNARQQWQRTELEDLRRRLGEIERAIEAREQNKEVIVNSRIEALLASSPAINAAKGDNQSAAGKIKPSESAIQSGREDAFDESADAPGVPIQTSPGSPEAALPKLPPGMEARVHYVQEDVEVNGVRTTITRPVIEYVQIERPKGGQSESIAVEPYAPPPRKADANSLIEAKDSGSYESASDLDTRQRLALLDLQAAEEDYAAAEKALAEERVLYDKGVTAVSVVTSREKDLRHAAIELRRAKVKLNGLAAQRAELQSASESALVEANAEVERAEAKVRIAEANVATAQAKKAQLDADVEGAMSNLDFQSKKYKRLDQLANVEKAIDLKLVDEAEEKLRAAEAALSGFQAAAATGGADIDQAKAAVEEARAEWNIAEARRRAAQARLDRLKRQTPHSDLDPLKF